jgi:hypothetical protein
MRQAHRWLAAIASCLAPASEGDAVSPPAGREVRRRVEACLDDLAEAVATGQIATWLRPAAEHLGTVLRRLGDGLYYCYDVPGVPRTNNDLEHFYRQVKAGERRISGRKRADSFVVRVGDFAVYAAAAKGADETALRRQLAGVPAAAWQAERAVLRANQERQTQMRRFRLRRDAYLADLEARWDRLALPP